MERTAVLLCAGAVFLLTAAGTEAFNFTPGHYYASYTSSYTSTSSITEYNTEGQTVDALVLPITGDIRGIGFGPDGLMYGVINDIFSPSSQTNIVAFDANGTIHQTYACGDFSVFGHLSYGKIEIDPEGYFYVAGFSGIGRFNINDPDSFYRIPNTASIRDLQLLPNGNLLIAERYYVKEIDLQGNTLQTLRYFIDITSLQYDAFNDTIYVGTLGSSDENHPFYQLYHMDYGTSQILNHAYFPHAIDLTITQERELLIGNRLDSPAVLSTDLDYLYSFDGIERMYVTQYVPEPASLVLLGLGGWMIRQKGKGKR